MAADPLPVSAPAKTATVDRVRAQLAGDFPATALAWLDDLAWRGPVMVPLPSLDFSRSANWAAAKDKAKVARFTARVRAGWRKPVVLVKTPDGKITPVDGHTRMLACRVAGQPVPAWIGYAKANTGPWQKVHARQNP